MNKYTIYSMIGVNNKRKKRVRPETEQLKFPITIQFQIMIQSHSVFQVIIMLLIIKITLISSFSLILKDYELNIH